MGSESERKRIRHKLIEILKDAQITDVGDKIRSMRSHPSSHEELPVVNVYFKNETVERHTESPKSYKRMCNIEVELIRESMSLNERTTHNGLAFPLAGCGSGQRVVIYRTRGGRRIRRRLKELGLLPGAELQVINNDFPGPLIISDQDGKRQIVGRGIALHILVKPS